MDEINEALPILISVGIVVGFILLTADYIKNSMAEYKYIKKYDKNPSKKELEHQAKRHTIVYNSSTSTVAKKNDDLEIDFSINLANSTVKTETVYAD